MEKPDKIYYYGLGSNWAFTKLEDHEEAQRLGGFDYVVKHLDYGDRKETLYPINGAGEKIPFTINGIRCSRLERIYTRGYGLGADIQDKQGVIRKETISIPYRNTLINDHFIRLEGIMSDLANHGTWAAKEAEELRIQKEKEMEEEIQRLKKRNEDLNAELETLKEKIREQIDQRS